MTTFGDNSRGIGIAVDGGQNVYVEAFHVIRLPGIGFSLVPKTSKLSPKGEVLWSMDFLGSQGQPPRPPIPVGIAVDPAGNSYVLADGIGWLGSFINTGILLKYDTNGVLISTQATSHPSDETFMSGIVYDPFTGHLYVAGRFPFRRPNAFDVQDTMVLEYDTNLTLLAENIIEDNTASLQDEAKAIAVDGLGNVHVGANQFNFLGPPPFFMTINWLAAKFSPHLVQRLSKQVFSFGPPNVAFLSGIAADAQGNSYLAGGNIRFNFLKEAVLVKSGNNGYINKFHSSTDALSFDEFFSVAVDNAANAYVMGFSRINFTEFLVRMVKYDLRGNITWNLVLSDFSISGIFHQGIALDGQNNIYVVGASNDFRIAVAKFGRSQTNFLKIILSTSSVLPVGTGDPAGTRAQVEVDVVDSQGNLVPQVSTITLSVAAVTNSGGHDHDGNRPVGVFSGPGIATSSMTQAATGPDGKLFVTYTATFVGGLEMIMASLVDTPGVSTSAVMEVRERDPAGRVLAFLPTSPGIYVKDGGTVFHHGPGCTQAAGCDVPDQNHFARPEVVQAMISIALEWQETHPKLEINDISLSHGGAFDICGTWNVADTCNDAPPPDGGHKAHRLGRGVDIQTFPDFDPSKMPFFNRSQLEEIIYRLGGGKKNTKIIKHGKHWHVDFTAF